MTSDSFQVIIDLQIRSFAKAEYPVVMATLPANPVAALEILMFKPTRMCVTPDSDTGKLALHVDGHFIAGLDDRNGNFAPFKKVLDKQRMFALTLTTCGEGKDGTLYILTRTIMAENLTGQVLSTTGPQKMSYEQACAANVDAPENHCAGRSFKTAVELAIGMHTEETHADAKVLRLVN
jgi:hypothetical protein